MRIELPPWLLAPAYCLVGWSIGGRFNRPILTHAAKVLPALAASILALIAVCGGIAAALVHFAHVDALTAYLATSPGGANSVAIIAASTHVDMSFIMAMQIAPVPAGHARRTGDRPLRRLARGRQSLVRTGLGPARLKRLRSDALRRSG